MNRLLTVIACLSMLLPSLAAVAGDSPQEKRHEMMENVGDAAKKIGGMMKGEAPFDAAVANASLAVWDDVAGTYGELFPEGSESGYGTEAAPAIWTDRAGFEDQLAKFVEAAGSAVAANPQDLEALKAAAGPVFKVCKSCHETYRIDD
jgi:cytochrome c556